MSDPGISQNSACCKDFNDASARNSSELWTIKFRSVQVLLQLRTLGLCSQPIVMFSLSVERGQEPGGWRIWRCRWWSDWGFVQGRADFIVFHSKLLVWTNVFHIIWAWRRLMGCVWGLYEMHRRLQWLQSSWSKNLKPCDLNERRPFSHWSTCWDSQMEKERKKERDG